MKNLVSRLAGMAGMAGMARLATLGVALCAGLATAPAALAQQGGCGAAALVHRGAIGAPDEEDLGRLLLAIVQSARAQGFEPERALREATRELQVEIRAIELDSDNDAGVVGSF